jgi:predicted nucleic-acid-binding Zn-ribbon protein
MENKIFIEGGKKNKCPHCGITYSFENKLEILYRNITLFHLEKNTGEITIKCKQCKALINIKK